MKDLRPFKIVFLVAVLIIGVLTFIRGKIGISGFVENILVEAYGLLFDLLVIGMLIGHFLKKSERNQLIQRYHDEIDDFRNWQSEEAMHRIIGNIKRLNRLGVTKIDLSYCWLKGGVLKQAKLIGSNLRNAVLDGMIANGTDFSECGLTNTSMCSGIFIGCMFKSSTGLSSGFADGLNETKFCNSVLRDSDFSGSVLTGADFSGADLIDTDLSDCNLSESIFSYANIFGIKVGNTDFTQADFRNAKVDSPDMMGCGYTPDFNTAKTYALSKMDPWMKKLIKSEQKK